MTRVYALYEKSRAIGAILVTYLLAELSVALWIYCTPGGGRKLEVLIRDLDCKAEFVHFSIAYTSSGC